MTVLAVRVDLPEFRNVLVNALTGLDEMGRQQEAESASVARRHGEAFLAAAADHGVIASVLYTRATVYDGADRICDHARTRDLTLIAVGPTVEDDTPLAEKVLLGSGRPILVFPEAGRAAKADRFGKVAIAWDGSRTAARAVADALPVLERAGEARILVVAGEKPSVRASAAEDLVRHLQAHGVSAAVDEVTSKGEPIGRVLKTYVSDESIELLVMGGYGHLRAREIVLGGATASVLKAPPCPVLMSH